MNRQNKQRTRSELRYAAMLCVFVFAIGTARAEDECTAMLLSAYQEYAAECFADSVLTHEKRDSRGIVTERKWRHREPSFTEFMEFLKKKNEATGVRE